MKNLSTKIIYFLLLFVIAVVTATPQELYTFTSPAQQTQFEQLTQQLRCLVCQNESLADSNAPLARDLRDEIYQKVRQGHDNQAIKDYLLARYGQFILFKPALNKLTFVLWFAPFILLLIGFAILARLIFKGKKAS
jgi:cytochrome c-type biogenesis protein CcmH